MKTKKLNKSEIRIKELENQVEVLKNTCARLDSDKEKLIIRNINLTILMNKTIKEMSTSLHNITSDLGTIS